MACDSPFFTQVKGSWIPVPCGKCPSCRKRRTDEWAFRIVQESLSSETSLFVTLTYDPEHVPLSGNLFPTLQPKDFTDFMKRLRRLEEGSGLKLKYYMCGEYGTKNKRPHYHMCIFNVMDESNIAKAWSLDGVQFGIVHVGTVTSDSAAYTVGYMSKTSWRPEHGRDDRIPEYSRMSKGLGARYITPAISAYHKADLTRTYLTKDNGDKIAMPRYYKKRIFTEDEAAEQGRYVELAVGEQASRLHRHWLNNFSHVQSFGEYMHALREAKLTKLNVKKRQL